MTITLSLGPETERQLNERAALNGQDVTAFVHRLMERELSEPVTLRELLAPLRREFAESGVTEELGALIEEAREEVRQERQKRGT
jgi:hypothetical protein